MGIKTLRRKRRIASRMIAKWEAHRTRLENNGFDHLAGVVVGLIIDLEKELEKIEEMLRVGVHSGTQKESE